MPEELTKDLFRRFSGLIAEHTGLYFDEGRVGSLGFALRERARQSGSPGLADYYDLLASPTGQSELRHLLDLITVPETSFFRNQAQFRVLSKQIIPDLTRGRGWGQLRFWSAGCSIGAEAYSLALTALTALEDRPGWQIEVLATDISARSLAAAARGVYSARIVQTVPHHLLAAYFAQHPDGYVVAEQVRRLVRFAYLNLVDEASPLAFVGQMDVVFCQNVLIYFQPEHIKRVINHIKEVLRPGGYLFLGYSETLWGISQDFRLLDHGDCFIYQKPAKAPPRAGPDQPRRPAMPPARVRAPSAAALSVAARREPPATTRNDGVSYEQAQALFAAGQGEAALNVLRDVLARQPDDTAANLLAARIHAGRADLAAALAHVNRACQIDPLNGEAHFLRGIVTQQLGLLAEAASSFARALYVEPQSPLAHFHLANLYRQQRQSGDARREYHNAIRLLEQLPQGQLVGEFSPAFITQICRRALAELESEGVY